MLLEPVCLICTRQLASAILEPVGLNLRHGSISTLARYTTKNHSGNLLALDAVGRASILAIYVDPKATEHIFIMQMDSEHVWLGWADATRAKIDEPYMVTQAKVAEWHADINNWTLRDCDEIPSDILRASRLAEALAGCKF